MEASRQPPCPFLRHCGSVKQDNKRYFILYLQLASCVAGPNQGDRLLLFLRAQQRLAKPRRHHGARALVQLLLQVIVRWVWVDAHAFALQGNARYPVDESRSGQADGGAESVHFPGRI